MSYGKMQFFVLDGNQGRVLFAAKEGEQYTRRTLLKHCTIACIRLLFGIWKEEDFVQSSCMGSHVVFFANHRTVKIKDVVLLVCLSMPY